MTNTPPTPYPSTRIASIHKLACVIAMMFTLAVLPGCKKDTQEVVDLDRVLQVLDRVLAQDPDASESNQDQVNDSSNTLDFEDPTKRQAFLDLLAKELNAEKIITEHIGVMLSVNGEIIGFKDKNKNNVKDSTDIELFKIMIDEDGQRIIATQTIVGQTYRRSHSYSSFYTGYWMGSMLSRQRGYYSAPGRERPNYSAMSMSSTGYKADAANRVKSASRSARSSGGSRSFFGGK